MYHRLILTSPLVLTSVIFIGLPQQNVANSVSSLCHLGTNDYLNKLCLDPYLAKVSCSNKFILKKLNPKLVEG